MSAAALRRAVTPPVLLAWGLTVLLLALVAAVAPVLDHSQAFFTREPVAALLQEPCQDVSCSYIGVVSNLGILAWATGAAVALFTALTAPVAPRMRRMLLAAGAITVVLLADDMFLLHENVYRQFVPRGETGVLVAYLAMIGAFAAAFRRELAALPRTPLAALALVVFGASIAVDRWVTDAHVVEDGTKLLAIVTWTAFLLGTARDAQQRV